MKTVHFWILLGLWGLTLLTAGCTVHETVRQVAEPAVDVRVSVFPKGVPPLAKHEPATGCLLGAYIDLDPSLKQRYRDSTGRNRNLPDEWESIIGRRHSMYFFYLGYGRPAPVDWIRKLAEEDRFVHIALEPNDGLDQVRDDAYLRGLARDLFRSGARIFVRFGSEVNGPWVKYHGNPIQFKDKFRLITNVFREEAPNVAMIYCPYTTPIRPILDYYPGDEWVDWVGVNMYNVTYFDQDPRKPARHILPTDKLDYVYKTFATRKPIFIAEYATTHFSALENKPDPAFAIRNIRQLYSSLQKKYPRVKAITYFNSNNLLVKHRKNNNYTLQDEPSVLQEYLKQTASPHWILKASQVPFIEGEHFVPAGESMGPIAGPATVQVRSMEGKILATLDHPDTSRKYLTFDSGEWILAPR